MSFKFVLLGLESHWLLNLIIGSVCHWRWLIDSTKISWLGLLLLTINARELTILFISCSVLCYWVLLSFVLRSHRIRHLSWRNAYWHTSCCLLLLYKSHLLLHHGQLLLQLLLLRDSRGLTNQSIG